MNVWNKVLLGLIVVLLIPLAYFGLVALKTHKHWRDTANKIEARIPVVTKEIERIEFGDPTDPKVESLQSVRVELYKYLVNRGRVWRNCAFQQADPQKGEYRASIDKPDPHELAAGAIVYVFDEAAVKDGGCFLGEFKVGGVDKKVATLSPTMRLGPKAAARLAAGKGSWTICEVMPNDVLDGKQENRRDFYVLLKEVDRQETMLLDDVVTAQRHKAYMDVAIEDAKKQQLFHQEERATLLAELEKAKAERAAALAHEQTLAGRFADLKAKMDQLIQDNRATAEEIGRIQASLIRQVDRRTAAVAK